MLVHILCTLLMLSPTALKGKKIQQYFHKSIEIHFNSIVKSVVIHVNWGSKVWVIFCQSLCWKWSEVKWSWKWSKWTEQLDWDTFVVLYVFFTFIRASHTFGTVLAKWTYHCFIAIWNQNYPFKWMTFILKGLTNIFLNAISQYLYGNEWCKVFIIVLYVAKIFHPCYLWFRYFGQYPKENKKRYFDVFPYG